MLALVTSGMGHEVGKAKCKLDFWTGTMRAIGSAFEVLMWEAQAAMIGPKRLEQVKIRSDL